MKKLIFVLSALMMSVFATAQNFEGKIVFDVVLAKDIDAQVAPMLPKEGTLFVKDGNSRMEMMTGMGTKSVTLTDSKAKTAVTLMDMMGQKIAIKSDLAAGEKAEPKVTITKKTKMVAGYKVTQAIVETPGADGQKPVQTELWFAKDLPVKASNVAGTNGKIEGAVLEYSISQKGMNMTLTAKSVTKETVEDSKFVVPEGYVFTTMEELMKSMGGGK